ncbi:hypothetical protein LZ554_006443 [Drepanopeziza brunnea f. sp. 'monogermtubi']|nr:hypothetical protein LZ554_006443 [Drepanopeziza brunnea f. sp. 'monogermtubi']
MKVWPRTGLIRGIVKGSTQRRHNSRFSVAHLLEDGPENGSKVVVDGYIRSVRKQKDLSFAHIGDGTTVKSIQAVMKPEQALSLNTGAAVRFTGSWTPSTYWKRSQSHELVVEEVHILGDADPTTFPLQKKWHTPEYLRTMPHMRARTPGNLQLLRLRSDAIAAVTRMFNDTGFVQTHTPIITSSDCEGAGEVFHVSSEHKGKTGKDNDGSFFRSPKYLTVSSQLHLEALAQSAGKVWTLSPTFRAEKSDTARHLSEFYMLEAELNFTENMEDVMRVAENVFQSITGSLNSGSRGATEMLEGVKNQKANIQNPQPTEKELLRRWRGGDYSFHRITYTDAIKVLRARTGLQKFEHEPKWGLGLQAEHERYIAHTIGVTEEAVRPVFVTHYPKAIKPFYMLPSSSGEEGQETVDCFDVLVPEACEIAGGSMREYRLEPLIQAMQANQMIPPGRFPTDEELGDLKWYVDLRRWGSAPHGGFGLGFDRLLAYLGMVPNIREVVSFPRWLGRCDC